MTEYSLDNPHPNYEPHLNAVVNEFNAKYGHSVPMGRDSAWRIYETGAVRGTVYPGIMNFPPKDPRKRAAKVIEYWETRLAYAREDLDEKRARLRVGLQRAQQNPDGLHYFGPDYIREKLEPLHEEAKRAKEGLEKAQAHAESLVPAEEREREQERQRAYAEHLATRAHELSECAALINEFEI